MVRSGPRVKGLDDLAALSVWINKPRQDSPCTTEGKWSTRVGLVTSHCLTRRWWPRDVAAAEPLAPCLPSGLIEAF